LERASRLIDFTITVFVTNQCQEPAQLLQASFIAYQTNFPSFLHSESQPPGCIGQRRSFSGLLPPLQKIPFVFRAQGCVFPASQIDSPRVTLETGRVVTEKGELSIPSVTETLP
jgi:hypothetical protein